MSPPAAAPPRGPGRPSTGVRVDIRIPADLLVAIDRRADDMAMTRAELVRAIVFRWFRDHPEEC